MRVLSARLSTLRYWIWVVASRSDPVFMLAFLTYAFVEQAWVAGGVGLIIVLMGALLTIPSALVWCQPLIAVFGGVSLLISPYLATFVLLSSLLCALYPTRHNTRTMAKTIIDSIEPEAAALWASATGKPQPFDIRLTYHPGSKVFGVSLARKGYGWEGFAAIDITLTNLVNARYYKLLPFFMSHISLPHHVFSKDTPSAHTVMEGHIRLKSLTD